MVKFDSTIVDTILRTPQVLLNNNTYYWHVKALSVNDTSNWSATWAFTTSITEIALDFTLPDRFAMSQNYPNPFNPTTTIKFGLPTQSRVKLEIYNTLGQRIAILVDEQKEAGFYEANWDASSVASGLYFYRLEAINESNTANGFTQVKKMILIK